MYTYTYFRTDLKQICPEFTNFDKLDEITNIRCGLELEHECHACDSHECVIACLRKIIEGADGPKIAEDCRKAVFEEEDFTCGIYVAHDCGKFFGLPLEFVECIEREKPCE